MASWDLSALYRHGASAVVETASGASAVASVHRDRVVLRDLESLHVLRTWTLPLLAGRDAGAEPDAAAAAAVSLMAVGQHPPHHVLVFAKKLATAWILDPNQDGEIARIDVGKEGAVAMDWAESPDPTVMSWSALHLRLSLFPVASSSAHPAAGQILSPKFSPPASPPHTAGSASPTYAGHSFHPNGHFLISLERSRSTGTSASSASSLHDLLSVYSTSGPAAEWTCLRSFSLPLPPAEAAQVDLAGVRWSPCGRYIAAWTSVTDYRVFVLDPLGHLLGAFTPYASLQQASATATEQRSARTANARPSKASTSAAAQKPPPPQPSERDRARNERSTAPYVGLGIRTVEWHPSGEYLAVGGYDGKIRILTRFGWSAIAELGLPGPSAGGAKLSNPVVVWREPAQWVEKTRGHGIVSFERPALPYPLPAPLPLDLTRPNPAMGVERLRWSPSGRWCAMSSDSVREPRTLERCRLHTVLLFTPASPSAAAGAASPAENGGSGLSPQAATGVVRDFAWQPLASSAGAEVDFAEEIVGAAQSEGSGEEEEVLVVATGQKGFAMWRAPRVGADGTADDGIAECVGIPARESG
ncbi:hypothetical protein JCM8202_001025 [Rhodotorula sphaerocarpa]